MKKSRLFRSSDKYCLGSIATVFFGLGILILTLSFFAIATNHQGFGSRILEYAYGCFVVGITFYLLDLILPGRGS